MMKKLRLYLWWKGKLSERKQDGKTSFAMPDTNRRTKDNFDPSEISEALKKKDKEKAERSQSRRRVRGGVPAGASRTDSTPFPKPEPKDVKLDEIQNEADGFVQL